MSRRLLSLFFLIAGGVLLALTLRHAGYAAVWERTRQTGFFLFPILAFPLTWNLLQTWAWGRILKSLKAAAAFVTLFRVRLAGAAASALLPMSHAVGEPLRAYWLSRFLPGRTAAVSVAIDRWLQTLSIVAIFSVAVVLAVRREIVSITLPSASWWGLAVLGFGAFVGVGLFWGKRFEGIGGAALVAGSAHAAARLAGIVEIYGLAWVVGAPLTWEGALFLSALDTVVNVLFAPVPANLGVMEGGFAAVSTRLHLDPAAGVAIQLLRRVRQMFWNGLGLFLQMAL